jgi:hypothetical protein
MKRFPAEFSDLLNRKGLRLLNGNLPTFRSCFRPAKRWFVSAKSILSRKTSDECIRLLESELFPLLKTIAAEVPRSAIWDMSENYSDLLPKAMLVKSADLNGRSSKCIEAAHNIGLMEMLHSESFLRLARLISGLKVTAKPGRQVLCYINGNYVGPHNDHHPESDDSARGYVDVQISLANDDVEHQWLVYERQGHLNGIINVGEANLISVYWLPFWHYTTPLVARTGRERSARRWLLLGTFDLPPGSPPNPKAIRTRKKSG